MNVVRIFAKGMQKELSELRIDKWLWAVRQFKTRSLAAKACDQGKIMVGETAAKASRHIRPGDEVKIKRTGLVRTLKVLQLTENRLSPKLVKEYCTDLTPQDEIDAFLARSSRITIYRDPGTGRPTKKERRALDDFFDEE